MIVVVFDHEMLNVNLDCCLYLLIWKFVVTQFTYMCHSRWRSNTVGL